MAALPIDVGKIRTYGIFVDDKLCISVFNCSSRQPNHSSSTLLSSLYSLWKTLGLCDLFLLKGNLTSYSCCD